MKKSTYTLLIILALTLTACGSRSNSSSFNPASTAQNGSGTGTLPIATELAIGTLKLDKTANDVSTDQATKLLPLWETMQLLETSDTAAKQEIDALSSQIQETMTAQQMQAITSMNLTRQDMFAILQAQGGGTGFGQQANGTSSQGTNATGNRNRNFGGGGFGPGAGGPPPDGGGFGGGGFGGQNQNRSASQIATAQAARQTRAGNRIPAPLINALIELLKKKAGS